MTEKIRAELDKIHQDCVELGRYSLKMLQDSIDAFETGDTKLAVEVTERKKELKTKFITIEESMFQSLALYQPVAKDMRMVVTSIRLIYNFERIGRMGYDIGETLSVLSKSGEIICSQGLISMGHKVVSMIQDALSAFETKEVNKILNMRERDHEIDSLYCDVLGELIRKMKDDKSVVPVLTRYVIIDRYLERCGDQACNIAEMTIYMVTGERVEIN